MRSDAQDRLTEVVNTAMLAEALQQEHALLMIVTPDHAHSFDQDGACYICKIAEQVAISVAELFNKTILQQNRELERLRQIESAAARIKGGLMLFDALHVGVND